MVNFPKIIQIETNIFCNDSCDFCPQRDAVRETKIMPDEFWMKIVDETRGRGMIYRPFMVNEPLTDKRLPEIIRYIKEDRTAKVDLNSNGGLLTEEWGMRLIEEGVDIIKFSVDGFSEESYRKSGRGDDYEQIVENINRFIELKKRMKGCVIIIVRMIDMDTNRHEQKDFLEYWGERADNAVIVPLYRWPWTGQERPVMKPCPKIREEMFFMTDGTAVLCCWDNLKKGVIGNIKESTVKEIWNGELNRKYRNLINEGRRDEVLLCSKCDGYDHYDFSNWKSY
ncbi:radical SAM/SPASM domain-containing protein [candidate division KSB1 bacterium]